LRIRIRRAAALAADARATGVGLLTTQTRLTRAAAHHAEESRADVGGHAGRAVAEIPGLATGRARAEPGAAPGAASTGAVAGVSGTAAFRIGIRVDWNAHAGRGSVALAASARVRAADAVRAATAAALLVAIAGVTEGDVRSGLVGVPTIGDFRVIRSAIPDRPVGRLEIGLGVAGSVGARVESARDSRQVARIQNRQRRIVEIGAKRIGVGGARWREAGAVPHQRQQQHAALPVNEPDVGRVPAGDDLALPRGLRTHGEGRRIVSGRQQTQSRRHNDTARIQIHLDGCACSVDREAVDLSRDRQIRIDDEHDLGHGSVATKGADPERAQRQPPICIQESPAHV